MNALIISDNDSGSIKTHIPLRQCPLFEHMRKRGKLSKKKIGIEKHRSNLGKKRRDKINYIYKYVTEV